jgi:hypothetical protein
MALVVRDHGQAGSGWQRTSIGAVIDNSLS